MRSAARELAMKPVFAAALLLAGLLAAPRLCAQTPGSGDGSGPGQSKPAANSQTPPPAQQPTHPQTQSNSNPFPEDTDSVPVIPTKAPDLPPDIDAARARMPLPSDDLDPVRSPEDAEPQAEQQQSSSSSLSGMSSLLPDSDDDTPQGKRGRNGEQVVPEHHETAAEDENVGGYYLSNKDWKAALSRYQSALVLDPDNPDVYWGLAESERNLGDFADARANYQKVMEYDPDSHHAKEARKALQDPQLRNAKASAPALPSPPTQ